MAQDHSFDIVSKPNMAEIDNAILMATKELVNRFDLKGTKSTIEKDVNGIKVSSDDEFKLKTVVGILQDKLVKRKLPLKFFEYGPVEQGLGGTAKQTITIKQGIPQDRAKEINKLIKTSGLKVQSQIQGDEIRVFAAKIDDLQAVIQKLRAANLPIELQFINYR